MIHSRTTFWYKERTVTTQAGSLITVEGESLCIENSKESKQDEFHKTCMNVIASFETWLSSYTEVKNDNFAASLIYLWKSVSDLSQQVHSNLPDMFLPLRHTFDKKTCMGRKSWLSNLGFFSCFRYPILLKPYQSTSDVSMPQINWENETISRTLEQRGFQRFDSNTLRDFLLGVPNWL